MSELLHYIKLRNAGNCNKKESECDKYLDCESCFEDKIKKHDAELLNKIGEYLFNSKYASEKIADLDYDQTVRFSKLEWYQIVEELKAKVE